MYEQIFPNRDHRNKAKCIYLLGEIYTKKKDYNRALDYYRKAYEMWKKTLVMEHPYLILCLKDINHLRWLLIRSSIREKQIVREHSNSIVYVHMYTHVCVFFFLFFFFFATTAIRRS